MELLIGAIGLLILGFVFGRINERNHFQSLKQRESELASLATFNKRTPPADLTAAQAGLVTGNVVVSIDYFKRLLAALRNILGGRVTSYQTLVERARREAILRMKEQAKAMAAQQVYNVRLETSTISGDDGNIGSIEVFAYGTALR